MATLQIGTMIHTHTHTIRKKILLCQGNSSCGLFVSVWGIYFPSCPKFSFLIPFFSLSSQFPSSRKCVDQVTQIHLDVFSRFSLCLASRIVFLAFSIRSTSLYKKNIFFAHSPRLQNSIHLS